MALKRYLYYAHHMYKYNSLVEEYEISLIKKIFPKYEVLNPNGDIEFDDPSDEKKIMQNCLDTISRHDVYGLVFSSLSGIIGKGVFEEINHARFNKRPIYYIHNNALVECDNILFTILNESDRLYALVSNIK